MSPPRRLAASGPVAGLVLAAGASSRMGSPKPLLPLGEHNYLEAVVGTLLAGGLATVGVVTGCEGDRVWAASETAEALRFHNPDWRTGMLSSWIAGLRALERLRPVPAAAVVALVDTPRFSSDTVRMLVDAFRSSGRPVVRPRYRSRSGHPVLVARSLWSEIEEALPSVGARAVVGEDPARDLRVDVDDPWILRDADTPDEHERMVREPPGSD